MITSRSRNGYVLLITVLTVGVVSSASAIAILLLGLSVERNAFSIQISTQALAAANSCAENAVKFLQNDLEYEGNEERDIQYGYYDRSGTLQYDTTPCKIYPVMGADNDDRVICTEATFGNFTTRRFEINIDRVLPSTVINSWSEVGTITQCDSYTGEPAADCGNGFDDGEECDDGNNANNDGCSSVCLDEFCGDGTRQTFSGEECDDGGLCVGGSNDGLSCNAVADCPGGTCTPQGGDGCSATCTDEVCGDSTVQTGEECDVGDTVAGDGCSDTCTTEFCGDQYIDADGPDNVGGNSDDEECDDGGLCVGGSSDGSSCIRQSQCPGGTCTPQDGDGCDSDCAIETSGSPSPTDYILYWKLDESSSGGSDSTIDSSGNGYHGTPEGASGANNQPQPSADKAPLNFTNDYAFDFDGTDDRIAGPADNDLFPDEVTISFWTKNDVSPQQNDGIFCKTKTTVWDRGWGFYYESASEVRFFIEQWNNNKAKANITPTVWNHIAGTYDGTTIKIYVNGVEGFEDDTYTGSVRKDRAVYAGRCGSNDDANAYNIDGKLDDFRIYDRVLSEAEITALASGN